MNILRSIVICAILSSLCVAHGQNCNSNIDEIYLNSVMEKMGTNKKFDSGFIIASLPVLEHYPELKNTKINFNKKRISTLMAARSSFASIL
ncbi:MAG: hypothetical protein JW894_09150 [Bacteroidales bacterium]|nr:hypothetical protein [Bacteroidales bacterium]